ITRLVEPANDKAPDVTYRRVTIIRPNGETPPHHRFQKEMNKYPRGVFRPMKGLAKDSLT
ncbi:MAG: hypothetical protein VX281_05000, partial [Pseudomonadota bacterium]|nr:hypothetical protein [Pseudomonadota bacterium]